MKIIIASFLFWNLSGCAVISVADAGVTVVATGVKITANAVGAIADVVIPNQD